MSKLAPIALALFTALLGSCQIHTDGFVMDGLRRYPYARMVELAPTDAEVRSLVVHSSSGDIVVHGGCDANRLSVRVHERFPESCLVRLVDGRLELDVGRREALIGDIEIWLVDEVDGLVATTGSGDVFLAGLVALGRVGLESGSGEIEVEGLYRLRALSIDTGAGDVVVRRCDAGEIGIKTGAGDIALESVHSASVELDSGIGDVSADGCTIATLDVDTGLGDVTIVRSSVDQGRYDTGLGAITQD